MEDPRLEEAAFVSHWLGTDPVDHLAESDGFRRAVRVAAASTLRDAAKKMADKVNERGRRRG